jgi:hypothetical protein
VRQPSERDLIQIRYARAQSQGVETDTEALLVLFEGDGCLSIELRVYPAPCNRKARAICGRAKLAAPPWRRRSWRGSLSIAGDTARGAKQGLPNAGARALEERN